MNEKTRKSKKKNPPSQTRPPLTHKRFPFHLWTKKPPGSLKAYTQHTAFGRRTRLECRDVPLVNSCRMLLISGSSPIPRSSKGGFHIPEERLRDLKDEISRSVVCVFESRNVFSIKRISRNSCSWLFCVNWILIFALFWIWVLQIFCLIDYKFIFFNFEFN